MQNKTRLPIRITLLLWLVLIISAWNTVRLVTSIGWRDTLETYAPWPGPFYIGLTGAVWTITGLFLFIGFVRRARWTRIAFLMAGLAYPAWVWADKLFVQAQLRANWPFDLIATLVLAGFMIAVVLDPRNKNHFMKRDL